MCVFGRSRLLRLLQKHGWMAGWDGLFHFGGFRPNLSADTTRVDGGDRASNAFQTPTPTATALIKRRNNACALIAFN